MNSSQGINFMGIKLQGLIDCHSCEYFENPGPLMGRVAVRVELQLKRILEYYLHQAPSKRKCGGQEPGFRLGVGCSNEETLKVVGVIVASLCVLTNTTLQRFIEFPKNLR